MQNLVNYSSSEESSDDEKNTECGTADRDNISMKRKKLPLPGDIVNLFADNIGARKDNSVAHGGRQRSFPHVEGNWATLIYAPYEPEDDFYRLQKQLFQVLSPLEFQEMDDYHVSLSRTVTIRHHWIQDIKAMLQEKVACLAECACEIEDVALLSNDEKTRSFLVLKVTSGDTSLENYVASIDDVFKQYKLEKYYQPPVFHISIGWCLDDVTSQVTEKTHAKLKETLKTALLEDEEMRFFYIDALHMKTGNKQFTFPLGGNTKTAAVT